MKESKDFKQRAKNLLNLMDPYKVLDEEMIENGSIVVAFNMMEIYNEGYLAGKEDALQLLKENLSSNIRTQKGE